jgi:2-succinyl-6-hydroxy-2,4-cyclohexadiene-1-carboxylate synthase
MPPIQQHRMRQQRLQQNPENLAASLEQMGTGSQPNFWSQLPQMTTPTTLIVGGRDQKFYQIAQRLRKLIPKAKLVVLTDAGHNTHFEVPEQFINLLKDGC